MSRIVITSGPKAGLELPLGTEPLTIGRSSESGLVIRDDYTSSHHARLLLWGDQWMIQDLDSTNGTWHDGVRVTAPVPIVVHVQPEPSFKGRMLMPGRPLADLGRFECRFAVNDAAMGELHLFCGTATNGGRWCDHHKSRVFLKGAAA